MGIPAPEVMTVEDAGAVQHAAETREEVRIRVKTFIAVAAINFLCFAQMMAIVGAGLLAQPSTTLMGDSSKAVWLSTIVTICNVVCNPALSQAVDYWGRKWFVVGTALTAVAGTIIIARAQALATLIAGFCILGIGFACTSTLYSIPSEIVSRRHRATAQASINLANAVGGTVSILIGGALLRNGELQNYRIYWYITAGLNAAGAAGIVIGYNPPTRELQHLPTTQKLRRLDWVGLGLYCPGLTLFCVALQWSKNPYGWDDVHILAPFILSVVLLAAFIIQQWRFKKDGIFDHALFGHRNWVVALITMFVEGLIFFAVNNYLTFEVAVLHHKSLFEAGLRFLVFFIASGTSGPLTAIYTTYMKSVREPVVAGFILMALSSSLLSSVKVTTSINVFWAYPILTGLGMGTLLVTLPVAAQLATPPQMISVTTGIIISIRSLGGAVGLAINNALFYDALTSNLGSKVAAAVLPLGYPIDLLDVLIPGLMSGNANVIAQLPKVTPEIIEAADIAIRKSYVIAFRNVWIATAVFSGFGVLASVFLHNPTAQFTHHIDAPVERRLHDLQIQIETTGFQRQESSVGRKE